MIVVYFWLFNSFGKSLLVEFSEGFKKEKKDFCGNRNFGFKNNLLNFF